MLVPSVTLAGHAVIIASLLIGGMTTPHVQGQGGCTPPRAALGLCDMSAVSASNQDNATEVTGTTTQGAASSPLNSSNPESANQPSASPTGSAGSGSPSASAPVYRPLNPARFGTTDIRCVITVGGRCEVPFVGNAQTEDEDAVIDADGAATVVTISDIASFAPRAAVQFMQPDRWMVVGLPTNFYAQIDRHVVSGTLLGQPADVRFTPRAYNWSYGDGTTALSGTPGNTWQALGLAEFDPTATSHVYTVEGTYVIDLTVLYTAEYRWAGGAWTPIAGHVELPANPLVAEATSDAVTVLVDRDCTRAPVGPGC